MTVSSGVVFVLLVLGLAASHAVPSEKKEESKNVNTVFGAEKCSEAKGMENAVTCAAMSTLRRLEDLSVKENIEIMPGVILTSDIPKAERESRQKRTMELPKNTEEKISKIFDMMYNVMNNLFSGRTLKIKMSENPSNSVMRAFEEGRGKMKKIAGPLMMALGAKLIAVVPIMLGGLALFASKALIISKIALVLALALGAQNLFSGGGGGGGLFSKFGGGGSGGGWGGNFGGGNYGGGGHNYIAYGVPTYQQNWQQTGTSQAGYSRSIDEAQDLAYASHKE